MPAPQYALVIEGLDNLKDIKDLDRKTVAAARMALNRTLDHTRAASAREIRSQINFPASYVAPAQGRLAVVRKATNADLSGVIKARGRATSLARFASTRNPGAAKKAGGVTVQVAPGHAKFMKRAFLVRLPAGKPGVDTKSNLGLAIRVKPGESMHNKKIMAKQFRKNVYLLYGPSVAQAFDLVAQDDEQKTLGYLSDEFLRIVDLDL